MMAELFEAIASWRSLLLVFVVFGFAPGFLLRLLVKIYPKNDPRRQELVAQLYTPGRLERVLFVGEQFETVLFEGVPARGRALGQHIRRAGRRFFAGIPRTLKAKATLRFLLGVVSWLLVIILGKLVGDKIGDLGSSQGIVAFVLLGAMLLTPTALTIRKGLYLPARRREAERDRDRAA
jgi:hypothetical protein